MKRVAALGVLLSSAVALGFQAPPQSPSPSPPAGKPAAVRRAAKPTPPVLEGTVKGPDGKPVAQALVLAQPSGLFVSESPRSTRTDDKGAFRLVLKSPTPHTVRVDATGFAGQTLRQLRPGSPVSVTLTRGGAIEGTVRDGSGQPVAAAKVQARDEGAPPSAWEVEAGVVEATADAQGRFRLEGLSRGAHTVTATAKGYGRAQKRSVTVGSRVDLYLFPGSSVSGTVIGPDGRGVKGVVVRAESEVLFAREARTALSDAAGRFDLMGLDRGTYRLTAHHAEFAPATVAGVYIEAGSVAQADLVLTAGSVVAGRLVNGEEQPVKGRVGVQEVDGRPVTSSLAELLRAEAAEDGRFRIGRVPPGSHALVVQAPGFPPKRVDVEVGTRGGEVAVGDVVLESGLVIRGYVRDRAGQGVPYAQITAFPARPTSGSLSLPAPAESGDDGSFVLAGVGPTSYRLSARAAGYGSTTRTVEAGTDEVELVLDPAGTVTGVVVDERDRPLEAFRVTGRPSRDSTTSGPGVVIMGPPGEAIVSPDGRFTLTDLAEGTWILEATAPGHVKSTVGGVKVAAGSTTDVGRIRLDAGGIVRGSVVNASGMPIVGATVEVQGASREFMRAPGEVFTDSAGLFEVHGIAPGAVVAVARHPQYAEGRVSGIEVDPAKGATETRIVLSQGGRLEGSARTRDGKGIPGVSVQLMPSQGGLVVDSSRGSLSTSPDGTFVAEHVPPGRVMVTLMGRQGGGRYLSRQSKEVDVREGETATVEFLSREILVTGRVTLGGEPAPGLRIRLAGQTVVMMAVAGPAEVAAAPSGPERMTAVTGEDGSYEMLVDEPGRFFARIESADGKVTYPSRPVEIPDAESHVVDFAFTAVPVAGVVVDAGTDQPVPDAGVIAVPDNRESGPFTVSNVTSGSDGRFRFELEPGEYRLRANAPGYAGAETSLTVGGEGVSDVRVALTPGQEIAGRVVDARGQGVGSLSVMASGQEPSALVGGMTQPDGSFVLTGLARGTYTLFAWSDVAGYALRPGVAVGSRGVVLALRPAGRVRVQVLGPDGAPVAGVRPVVVSVAGARVRMGGMGISASTDAQGFVEIPAPPGAVEITASQERMMGRTTVTVTEGVLANAEIRLSEPPSGPRP